MSIQSTDDNNPEDSTGTGTEFPTELERLDFGQVLGGPLTAAVNAEAQAAMVTYEYINAIAFTQSSGGNGGGQNASTGELRTAQFGYTKDGVAESVTVPLISMLPIPYLRVSQLSVDLNVKLHSVETHDTSKTFQSDTTLDPGGFLAMFSPVKFHCEITDKNVASGSTQVDRQYTLNVKMLAVQDAAPGGMAKVLQIFEDAIQAQTTTAPSGSGH